MKKLSILILSIFALSGLFAEEIDPVVFFNEYNKNIISSHDKLVLMNKPKKLQKLGKESKKGDISGTVAYRTKVRGFSGVVTIKYTDYSDNTDWILNGDNIIKANLFANGKMSGTVTVSGKYNAKISYDNLLIKKGNAGGGFYTIEYQDGRKEIVHWDAILNEDIAIEDADNHVENIEE